MSQDPVYPSVHMMYFPWDRHQRMQEPTEDFDRAPFKTMVCYAHPMPVELWTFDRAMTFCRQAYPEIAEILSKVSRPVMLVDVLRWLVVYRFGGVYLQYNTDPLVPMSELLPAENATVRLFTEFELNAEQCQRAVGQPIRQGMPEEAVRILIQCFSAKPGAPFVKKLLDLLLERIGSLTPRCDYDILFITGNAAASTAYDRYGKQDPDVERIGLTESRKRLKWFYRGTWRVDARADDSEMPSASSLKWPQRPGPVPRWIRNAWYRFSASHAHEALLSPQSPPLGKEKCGEEGTLVGPSVRQSNLTQVHLGILRELHVETVTEIPCGSVDVAQLEGLTMYAGGDLNRRILAANRVAALGKSAQFKYFNLLYSSPGRCDLVLCADFLELLCYREALQVLNNIFACRARLFCVSTHPCLLANWETALGDYRPLNMEAAPFRFPAPERVLPAYRKGRRSDRVLAVWPMALLQEKWSKAMAEKGKRIRK